MEEKTLVKITPEKSCCKRRINLITEIEDQKEEIKKLKECIIFKESLITEYLAENKSLEVELNQIKNLNQKEIGEKRKLNEIIKNLQETNKPDQTCNHFEIKVIQLEKENVKNAQMQMYRCNVGESIKTITKSTV